MEIDKIKKVMMGKASREEREEVVKRRKLDEYLDKAFSI